jgi:hypothetical protein
MIKKYFYYCLIFLVICSCTKEDVQNKEEKIMISCTGELKEETISNRPNPYPNLKFVTTTVYLFKRTYFKGNPDFWTLEENGKLWLVEKIQDIDSNDIHKKTTFDISEQLIKVNSFLESKENNSDFSLYSTENLEINRVTGSLYYRSYWKQTFKDNTFSITNKFQSGNCKNDSPKF